MEIYCGENWDVKKVRGKRGTRQKIVHRDEFFILPKMCRKIAFMKILYCAAKKQR
jgi:hypothetical protein